MSDVVIHEGRSHKSLIENIARHSFFLASSLSERQKVVDDTTDRVDLESARRIDVVVKQAQSSFRNWQEAIKEAIEAFSSELADLSIDGGLYISAGRLARSGIIVMDDVEDVARIPDIDWRLPPISELERSSYGEEAETPECAASDRIEEEVKKKRDQARAEQRSIADRAASGRAIANQRRDLIRALSDQEEHLARQVVDVALDHVRNRRRRSRGSINLSEFELSGDELQIAVDRLLDNRNAQAMLAEWDAKASSPER